MSHWDRGELRDALPYFQRALKESPDDLNVIYRTILTLVAMRDYAGCAKWLKELLPHIDGTKTEPWMMSGFHYNLGISYEATGEWDKAAMHYAQAISYDNDSILPKVNMGGIAYRLGQPERGAMWHDQVLNATDVDREARPTKAFLHLLRGDYLTGFREYEHRWKLPQILSQSYIPKNAKRWKGEPLSGKKILVVGEQGVGDVLMMARYIPRLVDMGLRPILVVHAGLVRLMSASFPECECFAIGGTHPNAGYWVPMMSLPLCFQTTLETIPEAKCLTPPGDAPRVDLPGRLRVGWVSKGNALHMGDHDRSCHTDAWDALKALSDVGVHFVNLDERVLKEIWGVRDFADTAAIIRRCDLIISIDSAVAHCAGALGKPVWLLPPCAPEWRWGLPDTPGNHWYPQTHRLYRRTHVDAWPSVIADVRRDLEAP